MLWNGTIYQMSVRLLNLPWRISIEPTIENRPKISQKSASHSISQKSTCYTIWYTENTYRADDWESSNNFSKIGSPFNFSNVGLLLNLLQRISRELMFENCPRNSPKSACYSMSPKPARGGGLGSRPNKMYGERLGDGVEYHLMKPTPRR